MECTRYAHLVLNSRAHTVGIHIYDEEYRNVKKIMMALCIYSLHIMCVTL